MRVTVGSDAHGRPAVVPDPQGTAPGRGAHLHPTTECYELAVRKKAFGRALRWSGPGGLESVAVREYVTGPPHAAPHETQTDHQREEGWSSSS
ncbi:YlxR family protein [Nocardioides anomalus]|uniref:YlxR family protein n=1 Tax=Nocardioides anomalus TaxID=2712223 RepID=UPI001E5ADDDF|nr:YlxR family protein [Nocardioides anomalus]